MTVRSIFVAKNPRVSQALRLALPSLALVGAGLSFSGHSWGSPWLLAALLWLGLISLSLGILSDTDAILWRQPHLWGLRAALLGMGGVYFHTVGLASSQAPLGSMVRGLPFLVDAGAHGVLYVLAILVPAVLACLVFEHLREPREQMPWFDECVVLEARREFWRTTQEPVAQQSLRNFCLQHCVNLELAIERFAREEVWVLKHT